MLYELADGIRPRPASPIIAGPRNSLVQKVGVSVAAGLPALAEPDASQQVDAQAMR